MTNHMLDDLFGILLTLRANAAAFPPESLQALSDLCAPEAALTEENVFRWVLRAWPPRISTATLTFVRANNIYPANARVCGLPEEKAMLQDIFHTAALLCREERLEELAALADAVYSFPDQIAREKKTPVRALNRSLAQLEKQHGLRLTQAPAAPWQETLRRAEAFARA